MLVNKEDLETTFSAASVNSSKLQDSSMHSLSREDLLVCSSAKVFLGDLEFRERGWLASVLLVKI